LDGPGDPGRLTGMRTRDEKDCQTRLASDALEALADHLGDGDCCIRVLTDRSGVRAHGTQAEASGGGSRVKGTTVDGP